MIRIPGKPALSPALVLAAGAAIALLGACRGGRPDPGIAASGTIETVEVQIAARTAGPIESLPVEEGSAVKAGQVLAVLDHAGFDIQLRQAEAGVRLAESQLQLLRQGARGEDIRQAEAALAQADSALRLARDDARRAADLAAQGSATPKTKEDAEARLAIAQAQWNAASEMLNKVRRLVRPEEIAGAEARLDQARAAADLLRKAIADCTIVSPLAGVVTHKLMEAGEMAGPGSALLTVSRLDPVFVMIYVSEGELNRVRLGQAVDVGIDGAPGKAFSGRIVFISPEAEFTPKNIQTKDDRIKLVFGVKVEIPNPEGRLKPGMPADALIRAAAGTGT